MKKTTARGASVRRRAGFTLLELLIVIMVIAILASLAVPNYLTSKKSANEASAISSMRTLIVAEENYRLAKGSQTYVDLVALDAAKLVNPALGTGSHSGYTFITDAAGAATFAFKAVPQDNAGDRYFFVDQTGVVRASQTSTINAGSPPLK